MVNPQERAGWWSAGIVGHYAWGEMVRRTMLDGDAVVAACATVDPLNIIAVTAVNDPSRRSYGYASLLDLHIDSITQAVAIALAADAAAIDVEMRPRLADDIPAPGEWGYDPVLLPVYKSMVARYDHARLLRLIGKQYQ